MTDLLTGVFCVAIGYLVGKREDERRQRAEVERLNAQAAPLRDHVLRPCIGCKRTRWTHRGVCIACRKEAFA